MNSNKRSSKMDFKEILDIFEVAHALGSSSFSENAEYSSDQDVEDTDNPYYGNNFDAETAVDCTDDLEKINMKETSSDQLMRYHFPDRRVAFMFYNCYGRFHGFAGRKSRVVKNTNGEVVQQTFVCHREGIRNANNALSRKREQKPTSRCRCPAKLQVHLDLGSERWYIKLFDDIHNHSFLDEKYEGMLPAHRKMSNYDKYQMKTMRKAGIPTSGIYGFFATQAGGYENLGYSRREMYNEQFKHRGRKSSDAEDAIDFIKDMCVRDDMMYCIPFIFMGFLTETALHLTIIKKCTKEHFTPYHFLLQTLSEIFRH
ncbi:putative protein FAR1-RELATED SEQUENCE 10 [Trifolium pratense]|uniref:putative protein FAR1-RELATED SEQUENCE 10 n=1 Tax=Trifolium pratense TaxID=57577 RepID=UPI001E696053|nr:putative protein FAR1-RELATED SEQUENCE 10 [Trifolium pratense]